MGGGKLGSFGIALKLFMTRCRMTLAITLEKSILVALIKEPSVFLCEI